MKQKILAIVVLLIAICLIIGFFLLSGEETKDTQKELKLSDFQEVFKENTVIVIGDNASEIEKESAEEIAASLENLTGNKPKIYISEKTESLKYTYNLVILGTPNSNEVLKEVCKMANVTRVTDEYPGEGKGILEILRNPWNEDKAMLLVAGSDEWGVKAGSEVLGQSQEPDKNSVISKWEESKVTILPNVTKTPTPVKYKPVTSHNEAIELANDYLNATLGSDFVKSHFEVLGIDERPDMPSVWLVLYKYKSSGYEINWDQSRFGARKFYPKCPVTLVKPSVDYLDY